MKRIIHPIGQGALYSEQFDNFIIVYDCGEWKKSKSAQQFVEKSFSSISTIDVLFISHFDFDHVSLIPALKQNRKIKICVLPVLNDVEKIILYNIYMALNKKDVAALVMNPKSFFGAATKIVYVKFADTYIAEKNDNTITETIIEDLNDGDQIPSGTELKLSEVDWIYVPYNIEHKERFNELITILKNQNLIIAELMIEYNEYIEKHIKEIRKAYKLLHGGINSNSMYLYSGPRKDELRMLSSIQFCKKKYGIKDYCSGCVYTGDGNLDVIKRIFQQYWNDIGTIQLPHHGSDKNYDFNFPEKQDKKLLFFASFGNNNSYGHPSEDVIYDINNKRYLFFPVSETKATRLICQCLN